VKSNSCRCAARALRAGCLRQPLRAAGSSPSRASPPDRPPRSAGILGGVGELVDRALLEARAGGPAAGVCVGGVFRSRSRASSWAYRPGRARTVELWPADFTRLFAGESGVRRWWWGVVEHEVFRTTGPGRPVSLGTETLHVGVPVAPEVPAVRGDGKTMPHDRSLAPASAAVLGSLVSVDLVQPSQAHLAAVVEVEETAAGFRSPG